MLVVCGHVHAMKAYPADRETGWGEFRLDDHSNPQAHGALCDEKGRPDDEHLQSSWRKIKVAAWQWQALDTSH